MKKQYEKPRADVIVLMGGAMCMGVSNSGQSGESAMGKEHNNLWEDDEQGGDVPQSVNLWD